MRPSGIGGQAVLEGIMMKNKEKYSVAVRKPDGQIEVRTKVYRSIAGDSKWAKLPLIRGVVNFIDSLVLGMESLSYSASFYDDEEEQELQVGIEGGKGEEHGHIDIVHGRGAHQKAHQNVQQNAEEIENGELVGTPLPLQGVADEVVEVEGDGKQENVSAGGGDKDKGNDPPDLPL